MALEICLVEDYMDDKLLNLLVFKLSAALDNYSLDQVITVGLALKYFKLPKEHAFFELFQEVVDVLVAELDEEELFEDSPTLEMIKTEFPDLHFPAKLPKVDLVAKPRSIMHSTQAYELTRDTQGGRDHKTDYYWIFFAETGSGSAQLDSEAVVQLEEQELKQILADVAPLQLSSSN